MSGKDLTSKEWEYIDPTPDIHALFIQFDQRFFWNRLQGVEVSWSKRMTLCAGVCSYQRRAGYCSIRLSEPLLKLRPRKDLVETLLHEMIHAFLFVTENNRDRDGHGPEFQKHMHRINNESGCRITIYHSFHDEVNLYKQHIWRCNGPCKIRKPFFGFVRRSMNRAPGPNDNWWSQHQSTCGGQFSKIQEPENYKQKKKTNNKGKNAGDITKYIQRNGDLIKPSTSGIKVNESSNTSSTASSNVRGLSDSNGQSGGLAINRGTGTLSNVSGFSNFLSKNNNKPKASGGLRGAAANVGGKTIVLSGGSKTENTIVSEEFTPFQGKGNVLGSSGPKNRYNTHDIPKALNSDTDKIKRSRDNDDGNLILDNSHTIKKIKIENVNCPVCNKSMSAENVDSHLDSCLPMSGTAAQEIDLTDVPDDDECEKDLEKCPLCDGYYCKIKMEAHINECVQSLSVVDDNDDTEIPIDAQTNVFCPICNIPVAENNINSHLDSCLSETAINSGL